LATPFDAQQLTDDTDYYDLPIPFHLLPQNNNDGEKQGLYITLWLYDFMAFFLCFTMTAVI